MNIEYILFTVRREKKKSMPLAGGMHMIVYMNDMRPWLNDEDSNFFRPTSPAGLERKQFCLVGNHTD